MTDTRRRPESGRIKTALVFLAFGSWGAVYGCSSSDGGTDPNLGNGGGSGTGGGGNASCGTQKNNPNDYPACTTCTGGRCVPKSVAMGYASLLTACDANNVCLPDKIVAQAENVQLTKCSSIGGGEGRCASTCIGVVASLAAYLPTTGCGADERCAPCFNPADGQPTGLCGIGCDQKPTGTPVTFKSCCSGAGLCAPKAALPASLTDNLGKADTCADTDVCVPAKPIQTPGAKFSCCSIPLASGSTLAGACVPACVIDAGPNGAQIPQANCATGEKCVPCSVDGTTPTGVCADASGKPAATCTP